MNTISKTNAIFCLVLLYFILPSVRAQPTDPEVAAIQAKIRKIQSFSEDRQYGPGVRGIVDTLSILATLSEEVILQQAKQKQLTATDKEAEQMLLPLLTQQGLIDPLSDQRGIWECQNVKLWLKGQKMEPTDLLKSAKLMVLWAKLATANTIEPSKSEVESYVKKHPNLRIIPSRVQIELTDYIAPPIAGTRGMMTHQILSPYLEIGIRGSITEREAPISADWSRLNLYLQLENLDPKLRAVLTGKKAGDTFGPVILKNGASVAGILKSFIPEGDLAKDEAFWQMAGLHLKLEQNATKEQFQTLTQEYFNSVSPNVRGFWSSVFGGLKKGFKYVTAGVGGIVGFYYGGPSGAVMGARYGYQAGSMIQGFWSSGPGNNRVMPTHASAPYNFRAQSYPTNYSYSSPYSNSYSSVIPAMAPDYNWWYERSYPTWRQPSPPQSWAPPLYYGASLWY